MIHVLSQPMADRQTIGYTLLTTVQNDKVVRFLNKGIAALSLTKFYIPEFPTSKDMDRLSTLDNDYTLAEATTLLGTLLVSVESTKELDALPQTHPELFI
jgi:hypothetical protein